MEPFSRVRNVVDDCTMDSHFREEKQKRKAVSGPSLEVGMASKHLVQGRTRSWRLTVARLVPPFKEPYLSVGRKTHASRGGGMGGNLALGGSHEFHLTVWFAKKREWHLE
jgi:hypothetical protein